MLLQYHVGLNLDQSILHQPVPPLQPVLVWMVFGHPLLLIRPLYHGVQLQLLLFSLTSLFVELSTLIPMISLLHVCLFRLDELLEDPKPLLLQQLLLLLPPEHLVVFAVVLGTLAPGVLVVLLRLLGHLILNRLDLHHLDRLVRQYQR